MWTIPSSVSFSAARPSIRSPSKRTSPPLSGSSPVIARSSVLLPWPLGPTRQSVSPRATVSAASRTIVVSP